MEMDIYMRRRLVALGGLVAFFIIFVLLVKSCGDDEEPAPLSQTTPAGTTGVGGAVPLSPDEFIPEADAICGPANRAVGALDPTDPSVIREEAQITSSELKQLQSYEIEPQDRQISKFLSLLEDVVAALKSKAAATQRGLTADADQAQVEIDTAEAEARALGERIGFEDCGQFLDAGQAPGGGGTDTGTDTGTEVAPTDTGTEVAPTETTPAPTDTGAAPTDTETPPATDDTGGVAP